ncbi:MAG: hypothetical protein RI978_180 [Verrucomicrobiota bacterium]|jgi:hypothetical protein
MSLRLQVIAPGRQAGGANLLLARTAVRLARRHGFRLSLVDFEDGATRQAWLAEGIPFEFGRYEVGGDIEIGQADVVMVSLLGAKMFPARLKGDPAAKLLAWCTAPQDPFKFLPPAYFFNGFGWSAKRAVARWLFPSHRRRIGKFLAEGARRGGVAFMDVHCHEVNEYLFGPGIAPTIVPICTGDPERPPRPGSPGSGKAYWVGRITDFKTEPFVAMTEALLRAAGPIKEVVVIGDGAGLASAQARLAGLPVRWLGYVPPAKLDAELLAHADLVFGHATALLEAAKLGIPSLLVDGSYGRLSPQELKAEWLHRCPPGYVGKIAAPSDLIGRPVGECLSELRVASAAIASADHLHWSRYHHPDAVADRLAEVIRRSDYAVADFLASGAGRPGWFGATLEWAKETVFRRRY